MRASHIYLAGVALATLGVVIGAPGTAGQEAPPPGAAPIDQIDPPAPERQAMPAEAQTEYDGWAPDQKLAYDAWPAETQAYYWTLEPHQKALFWRLSDQDKIAITAMTGPERDTAWKMIEERANGSADTADEMAPPPGDG